MSSHTRRVKPHTLVVMDGERALRIYDVAVGQATTPGPEGEFRIINRILNPAWYSPGKVVAPGKGNPLGTRWMGLSAKEDAWGALSLERGHLYKRCAQLGINVKDLRRGED